MRYCAFSKEWTGPKREPRGRYCMQEKQRSGVASADMTREIREIN
jgi:hypothetical protein